MKLYYKLENLERGKYVDPMISIISAEKMYD
jgi:hypothetical protein